MFKCIEAKDKELIKEIYRFRAEITCNELGSVKKEECIDGMEIDEYDKYSIQYAILDEDERIAACMRIIHHSPIGYPALNNLPIYDIEKKKLLSNDKMGELSRIFIRKDCRGIKQSKHLIESIKRPTLDKLYEHDIELTFGALEKSFAKLLMLFKVPYHQVGPYMMYGNRKRALYIMYTDELYSFNRELFGETVC